MERTMPIMHIQYLALSNALCKSNVNIYLDDCDLKCTAKLSSYQGSNSLQDKPQGKVVVAWMMASYWNRKLRGSSGTIITVTIIGVMETVL
jgi:hypothetical protein